MRWAMRWAPATEWRWRLSSTASIAGSAKSCALTTPTRICPALHGWLRYGKRSSAPRATPNPTIWSENRWFSRCSGCSRKRCGNAPSDNNLDNRCVELREFVVAKAGKKASKKRKAKKTRKALPARAGKKAAAKKRAAKKGATKTKRTEKKSGKASKKVAKKVAPKSPKKAAKKAATKSAKKSAKKSADKTTKTRAVTLQETNAAIPAAPVAKRAKPTTPRAKPAVAVQPAVAAERNTYFI